MGIELAAGADGQEPSIAILGDAHQIGVGTVLNERLFPRFVLLLDETACPTLGELGELIDRVCDYMADHTPFELSVVDPVVRWAARVAGFTGGLRTPLSSPTSRAHSGTAQSGSRGAEQLAVAVNGLLGSSVARPEHERGTLSRLARVGASGNVASLSLAVRGHDGGSFTVVVPDRPYVMPEIVGLAADCARGVRRAFPSELGHLRSIAFDHSQAGFSRGRRRLGGVAYQNLVTAHINANYTHAEGILAMRRHRIDHPPKTPPFRPRGDATFVDGVVAHELWHLIEGIFERRRYRDSIEFRRRLGEFLGVPSLEYVLRPQRGDSGRGEAALAELRQQVSAYATTNPREATAEMFQAWWWGAQPMAPLVAHFGELVKAFFPSARSATRGADELAS